MIQVICQKTKKVEDTPLVLYKDINTLKCNSTLVGNSLIFNNQIPTSIDNYGFYYTDINFEGHFNDTNNIILFTKVIVYKNQAKTSFFFTNHIGHKQQNNEILLGYCKNFFYKNKLVDYSILYKDNKIIKIINNETFEVKPVNIEKLHSDQHLSDLEFNQLKKSSVFFIKLDEELYEFIVIKYEPHNFKNCKNNKFIIIRTKDQVIEKLYFNKKCCLLKNKD